MATTTFPRKTYVAVWLSLLLLLGLTVGLAYLPIGFLSSAVAVAIAVIKTLIIAIYFMHLRHSPRLVWLFASAGVFWLLIMFTLSFGDYMTRAWLPAPTVWLN